MLTRGIRAKQKISRSHQKIASIRKDFSHKIVENSQSKIIVLKDLRIKNMAAKPKVKQTETSYTTSALDLFRDKVKDDSVYHPLGGCELGQPYDFWGRINHYEGLYINDGSCCLAVPPVLIHR